MNYLSIGHTVIVNIPKEDRAAHTPVLKYQGKEMKVADRISRKHGAYIYYHLVGAESEYGVPYGFIKEWLIPKGKGAENEYRENLR